MQKPDWFRLQEGIDNKIARLEKENAELRQQCDELLEALRHVAENIYCIDAEHDVWELGVDFDPMVVWDAINNVTGEYDE